MKTKAMLTAGIMMALVAGASAEDSGRPIQLFNRLRVGWDDNVYQTAKDETDSVRILEEIEVALKFDLEQTYLGLRYRPTLIWYSDRDDDDTDFLHDLTATFTQELTPSLQLSVSDTLHSSQLPELQDGDYIVRECDDNLYNDLRAVLSYTFRPETRLDLAGRYYILKYLDNDALEKTDNYWSAIGGVTLRQILGAQTTAMADFRYQTLQYDKAPDSYDRDVDTIFGGLGIEQGLGKQLSASIRAGVQHRMYDNDAFDDKTCPYVDGSLTLAPTESGLTRLILSAGWAMAESDVTAYLAQERIRTALTFAHKLTQRLDFSLTGSYTLSRYDADDAMVEGLGDNDENSYAATARLSYLIGTRNWVELGYQFTKLDSDIKSRTEYDRNRVDLGWRIQLF